MTPTTFLIYGKRGPFHSLYTSPSLHHSLWFAPRTTSLSPSASQRHPIHRCGPAPGASRICKRLTWRENREIFPGKALGVSGLRASLLRREEKMFKYGSLFTGGVVLAILAVAIPGRSTPPAFVSGAWMVDGHHSDAQYVADGTTAFGKTKRVF